MSNSDSDSNVQDSGRAIPTACHADGPLLMNFWERRQLDVTWEDGTTTTETSTIGNFTSEDIGEAFPVDYVETKTSQGGSTVESVFHDTSHPFALLGWILPTPLAALAAALFISGIVFLKPPQPSTKQKNPEANLEQDQSS